MILNIGVFTKKVYGSGSNTHQAVLGQGGTQRSARRLMLLGTVRFSRKKAQFTVTLFSFQLMRKTAIGNLKLSNFI